MELLSQSYLETTTQIIVSSNTITGEYLIDPEVRRQFISSGDNSDLTTTTIRINFDSTQTIDRIALMENNVKGMNIFYNGVTANTFVLTNPTTASQFTNNSATNLYLACTPVACTSVTFDLKTTMTANSEKAIGHLYLGANESTFSRLPSAGNYTPIIDAKELIHILSDGGTRRQTVQTKWAVKLKFSYVSETFRSQLYEIYNDFAPKVFVPFGTGTAWDGILFEANWIGDFNFNKYSDDSQGTGFEGSIELKET
jgi:hypothetical protein